MTDLLLTAEMRDAYHAMCAERCITRHVMRDRARRAYAVKRAGQLRECRERFA